MRRDRPDHPPCRTRPTVCHAVTTRRYGLVEECPAHLPEGSCKKGDYVSREQWGKVGGLTATEQRAQFGFWCMLAAPLMLGNDPRFMSEQTRRILTAPELLAISQDPLARQAERVHFDKATRLQIWTKPLAGGAHAVLAFNGGDQPADITLRWERDLPALAAPWAKAVPRVPACANKHDDAGCTTWAKGGECAKNPGFMKSNCMAACEACPPALYEGQQAEALVRNAWEREFEVGDGTGNGLHVAQFAAKHVEPHEARILVVRFGAQEELLALLRDGAGAARAGRDAAGRVGRPLALAAAKTIAGAATDPGRSLSGQELGRAGGHGPGTGASEAAETAETAESAGGLRAARSGAAHAAPPSLRVCAAEHADSLLLMAITAMCGSGSIVFLMQRCQRRERAKAHAAAKAVRSPRDRPHAV